MLGCRVSGREGSTRRDAVLVVLASALLVALVYLSPPTVFESEDYVKLHALNRAYLARSLLSGRLPLWNPHVGLGRPFLADLETAAFYPPNLLYLLLEPHICLALLLVAHTALLLEGMRRLGRYLGIDETAAWLVGVAFASSGIVVGALHKGQIPYGEAACWLPLLLLLAARVQDEPSLRRAADLALGLGFQFLCGHPQAAWLTWLCLGLFVLGRGLRWPFVARPLARGLVALGAALAAAAALTAVELLPFLELQGLGNRGQPSLAFSSVGALPWIQWASLALPAWPDTPLALGASFYVGSLLTLAGVAGLTRLGDPEGRGLALVATVGVLYSVGERTPVFALLYHALPGVSSFRFPGRTGLIVTLALLLGAGRFLSEKVPRRAALVAGGGAGLLVVAGFGWWLTALPLRGAPARPAAWLALAAASAALLPIWHLRRAFTRPAEPWILAGVLALAAGEVGSTAVAHKPFRLGVGPFPAERPLARMLAEASLLREGAPPPRVLVPYPLIRDDAGMVYGFANASGYVALTLDSVWVYLHEALGLRPPEDANTFPSPEIYGFGPFPYPHAGLAAGFDSGTSRLVLNPEPWPRAWIAGRATVVPDLHAAVAMLRAGQGRDVVSLFAPPPEGTPPPSDGSSRAEIRSFQPERLEIDVEASHPAMLVVAEPWYPGWSATVNGRAAACLPGNAWMRVVPVPGGRSHVRLVFRSAWLATGAAVSLATLALLLLARGKPASRFRGAAG